LLLLVPSQRSGLDSRYPQSILIESESIVGCQEKVGGNKEKDRQSGCDYVRSINLDGGRSLKHILVSMGYNS